MELPPNFWHFFVMPKCQRFAAHYSLAASTMADSDEGASLGVWIGLSIIAAVSFYCQAAVTEER